MSKDFNGSDDYKRYCKDEQPVIAVEVPQVAMRKSEHNMIIKLLSVAICPECDGSGIKAHQICDEDEGRAAQCRWCYEKNLIIQGA